MSRGRSIWLPVRRERQRGFTLVEMLVVSALIALFAGLAVFSITTQLEQNKKKAAVAECRQIATAMSFAYQDLGFFPKISLLKFNYNSLIDFGRQLGFSDSDVEYHGHFVQGLSNKLANEWKGVYLTNSTDRLVTMIFPGAPNKSMQWPADPWGNPYVAYLLRTERPPAGSNNRSTQTFLQNATQPADYFAGIVSYGRNAVPGLGDFPDPVVQQSRMNQRLYKSTSIFGTFELLTPDEYDQNRRKEVFLRTDVSNPNLDGPAHPHSMDSGSDDRVYQF